MGYDLSDIFMDIDFYCTKSNGKKVGLSWAAGYDNQFSADKNSYTYGFNVDNEKNAMPLIDLHDELNTGLATLNINGNEICPEVLSQIDTVEDGSNLSKYTVFTGVIGDIDDIKSITLPGNNTFDMTE